MERSEGQTVSAILDITVCMAVWSFARLGLSYVEKEAFFESCKDRLTEQGLERSNIDEALSSIKQSVKIISEGLNAQDKH